MHNKHALIQIQFFFLLVFIWVPVSGLIIYFMKSGINPVQIEDYYFGNLELYTQPKTVAGLLKILIPHNAAFVLIAFYLNHMFEIIKPQIIFQRISLKYLHLTLFILIMGDLFSGILIVSVHAFFIYIKIFSMLGFVFVLIGEILLLLITYYNGIKYEE